MTHDTGGSAPGVEAGSFVARTAGGLDLASGNRGLSTTDAYLRVTLRRGSSAVYALGGSLIAAELEGGATQPASSGSGGVRIGGGLQTVVARNLPGKFALSGGFSALYQRIPLDGGRVVSGASWHANLLLGHAIGPAHAHAGARLFIHRLTLREGGADFSEGGHAHLSGTLGLGVPIAGGLSAAAEGILGKDRGLVFGLTWRFLQ
ncbi:MAG: hypothetical protein AAB368_15655 [bacterium]